MAGVGAAGGLFPGSMGSTNEVPLADSVMKLLSLRTRPRYPRIESEDVMAMA